MRYERKREREKKKETRNHPTFYLTLLPVNMELPLFLTNMRKTEKTAGFIENIRSSVWNRFKIYQGLREMDI